MKDCMNCGSNHDVLTFYQGEEKLTFCKDCRFKLVTMDTNRKEAGRPSLGITKKVSLTLSKEDWTWVDEKAKGNRSKLLRYLIGREQSSESRWSNHACLGYAILGAQKLGFDEEQIEQLVRAIYSEFDWKTVEEARSMYEQSSY